VNKQAGVTVLCSSLSALMFSSDVLLTVCSLWLSHLWVEGGEAQRAAGVQHRHALALHAVDPLRHHRQQQVRDGVLHQVELIHPTGYVDYVHPHSVTGAVVTHTAVLAARVKLTYIKYTGQLLVQVHRGHGDMAGWVVV
jgi:hypothetical protein